MKPIKTTRPHMPGYGVPPLGEDDEGLLPWSWAEQRLRTSRNYWTATVDVRRGAHVMPVWGVWTDAGFCFSTGGRSRKARNLLQDPRCVVTTEEASEPVVLSGTARRLERSELLREVVADYERKYGAGPPDVDENPLFLMAPQWAFGVIERAEEFSRSATRWTFDDE